MPSICEAIGVSFEYPESWELEVVDSDEQGRQVVVSGPGTAFWQLSKHPPQVELESLFDEALAALRSEYHEIEAWPAASDVDSQQIAGYDVSFYCLDLTVTSRLRGWVTPEASFLLVCQAEDREMDAVAPVFHAMMVSLARGHL